MKNLSLSDLASLDDSRVCSGSKSAFKEAEQVQNKYLYVYPLEFEHRMDDHGAEAD